MAEITVVVIAYNEARRIEPCLSALLAQKTDVSFNVVVVDDGSTDATSAVVTKLMKSHPNLSLLRQSTNQGRGAARRLGQDSSTSRWIGFVDADIVVPSDWLDRCRAALTVWEGVSGVAQPDGDCAVVWRIARPTLRDRPGSAEITGNNVLFSRDVLVRVPFSPVARLGEDFRLAKTMSEQGIRLGTLKDLKVRHLETKGYAQGAAWMWQSGVDATALLAEFHVVRPPDLAWLFWLTAAGGAVALCAVGAVSIAATVAVVSVATLAVSASFTLSRFRLRPRFTRFVFAGLLSTPLVTIYLIGRTAGIFRACSLTRPSNRT